MKPSAFTYSRPGHLADALHLLQQHGEQAKVLAGGQSLIPAMNLRMATPEVLVDLADIEALSHIVVDENGMLAAGAMVTHNRFLQNESVREGWPPIGLAIRNVAHEPIRNRGTIGGSLCHADPAAEWAGVCLLLDAEMVIVDPDREQLVKADSFIRGVYETSLEAGQLLTQVRFPALEQNWRWGFHEIARRHGDFALGGALVGLALDADDVVTSGRLVVFAIEDRARRLDVVLKPLIGSHINELEPDLTGLAAAAALDPRSDLHASANLRGHLVHACVVKAVNNAARQRKG